MEKTFLDWSKFHCGLIRATYADIVLHMPELVSVFGNFPENVNDFTWDIKIHMLMPNQWPCIPNWHMDNVPRDSSNKQDFTKIQPDKPMYLWISGPPITEFKDGRVIVPGEWNRFTQLDEHRGTMSDKHQWRCFIRATHKDLLSAYCGDKVLRRHTQVYLDADSFKW